MSSFKRCDRCSAEFPGCYVNSGDLRVSTGCDATYGYLAFDWMDLCELCIYDLREFITGRATYDVTSAAGRARRKK